MLVFISDLHFVDGTAGEHNIPPRTWDYFFEDLAAIANKPSNKIKEIKIVLLGDIFDLLRTEKWFEFPLEERPWGNKNNESKLEANAQKLFDAIVDHNENRKDEHNQKCQTFKRFREGMADLPKRCKLQDGVRLFYVPGNHDRLVNRYPSLRQRVCTCLNIPPEWHNPTKLFDHYYEDPTYGVYALHGQEYDKFNYDGGTTYTSKDYQETPIGDPITTELVARLPYTLTENLKHVAWLTPAEKERIRKNFQEIENVRPLSATVEWLLYQVRQDRRLKSIIEDTVTDVVDYFESLDFVEDWYSRHDKWLDWRDEADKIQAFLFLLRHFKPFRTEELWQLAMDAKDYFVKDELLEAAPQEFFHLNPRIRYVVYGHTHTPLQSAIRSIQSTSYPFEQVYLNTGTWRGRYFKANHDDSFIYWKNMTYIIFYREGERGDPIPMFETWTGTLKSA
jgi:UDP-2,3-diacylglucosamine pyrophosphatase LpxH